ENEPTPLPINPQARLFVLGTGFTGNSGNHANDGSLFTRIVSFSSGTNMGCVGSTATPFGVPCACTASFWTYITGNDQGEGPMSDFFANDSPFVNATELLPIDLIQGTLGSWGLQTTTVFPIAPRTMGTIPHIRAGRSN